MAENGQAEIKGKLVDIREIKLRDEGSYYEHVIVEPAVDEYSHPKSFPVCSDVILGARGTVIKVVAEIRSWRSRGFYNLRLWAVQGA